MLICLKENDTQKTGKTTGKRAEHMKIHKAFEILMTNGRVRLLNTDVAILNDQKQMVWKSSGRVVPVTSVTIDGWEEIVECTLNTDEAAIIAIRDDVYIEDEEGSRHYWTGNEFNPAIRDVRACCKWRVVK